ncbi:MAG: hypothetical protein AAGJ18_17585 [Bacteroidota bacterium]
MTLSDFQISLEQPNPPKNLSQNLKALWYDGKENWDKAHNLADESPHAGADWIHAYLHRKEGDNWNANYWYRKARKTMPKYSLTEEWENLVTYFLEKES